MRPRSPPRLRKGPGRGFPWAKQEGGADEGAKLASVVQHRLPSLAWETGHRMLLTLNQQVHKPQGEPLPAGWQDNTL